MGKGGEVGGMGGGGRGGGLRVSTGRAGERLLKFFFFFFFFFFYYYDTNNGNLAGPTSADPISRRLQKTTLHKRKQPPQQYSQ